MPGRIKFQGRVVDELPVIKEIQGGFILHLYSNPGRILRFALFKPVSAFGLGLFLAGYTSVIVFFGFSGGQPQLYRQSGICPFAPSELYKYGD